MSDDNDRFLLPFPGRELNKNILRFSGIDSFEWAKVPEVVETKQESSHREKDKRKDKLIEQDRSRREDEERVS